MKKLCTALLLSFLLSATGVMALENDLTSRFKLWLLNNEARALSSLSSDKALSSRVQDPFSIIPEHPDFPLKAGEKIWEIHRKYYLFLEEIEHVYNVAARFGNGRFAIILKQSRPEIWGLLAFNQFKPGLFSTLSSIYRKAFYETLIGALKLDVSNDSDLSARLNRALKKLSDEEFRLFNSYLDTFSALYPSNPSGKMIKAFIQSGIRRKFASGIDQLLKPEFTLPTSMTSPILANTDEKQPSAELDDPLAELEKLAAMGDSGSDENVTIADPDSKLPQNDIDESNTQGDENTDDSDEDSNAPKNQNPEKPLEGPDPGAGDMFNIWD